MIIEYFFVLEESHLIHQVTNPIRNCKSGLKMQSSLFPLVLNNNNNNNNNNSKNCLLITIAVKKTGIKYKLKKTYTIWKRLPCYWYSFISCDLLILSRILNLRYVVFLVRFASQKIAITLSIILNNAQLDFKLYLWIETPFTATSFVKNCKWR